ncbi:MAG: hypothetical protein Q7T11_08865 [Deltaproteobacteria bacterium]|nr:hypothetical protein [Deltaproteobacteria bacterium]
MNDQKPKLDLELEAVMTESAFGHEYARLSLKEDASYTRREALLANMDRHKQVYFWARQKMEKINPDRLISIEEGLRWQKEMVLGNSPTLH